MNSSTPARSASSRRPRSPSATTGSSRVVASSRSRPTSDERLGHRRRRRPRAAARGSAPWPARPRRRAWRRPCTRRARSRRRAPRRSSRRRRERPTTRGAPRAAEYILVRLDDYAGSPDRREGRRHLRARSTGAHARSRAVESGRAVRLSPVGRARSDLPRGRSLHLSRPASRPTARASSAAAQRSSLDDGTQRDDRSHDGDELLLGDPTEPVVVRCRVKIEDDGRDAQEIIARRTLSELPEVQGKLERDPVRAAALYKVAQEAGPARARSQGGVRGRRRGDLRAGAARDPSRSISPTSRRPHEHRVRARAPRASGRT